MKISSYLTSLSLAMALLSTQAFAENGPVCSAQSAAGNYTLTCSGWTAAGPNATLAPVMQVGMASGDSEGNWTGSSTINIGGQTVIPNAKVSGKAIVNPDCTGSVTYNKGTPSELNISFVIFRLNQEIHGLVIDKGSVISCVLKRNGPWF